MSRAAKVQIVVLALIAAGWVVILGLDLFGGDALYDPPDRLDDRAFPVAAEPICAETQDAIEALGLPTEVESPLERAELVDRENDLLRAMLADLGDLDRPTGEQGDWVTSWLTDWRTHIGDRQDWADDLRAGDDHAFVETDRGGNQISKVLDNFAEVNDMPSCATTGDV